MLEMRQSRSQCKNLHSKRSDSADRKPVDIGAYGVLACVVLPPFLLIYAASFVPDRRDAIAVAPEVRVETPEQQRDAAEVRKIVHDLLPLFTLPTGKPMAVPTVSVGTNCDASVSARYWIEANDLDVCKGTEKYPQERLVRVLKHELVHAWIAQSGFKDDHSHGREFMKKAIEVGTLPLDEP